MEEVVQESSSYRHLLTEEFKESFEKKFRKNNDGCWIWTASRDKDDYGQVAVGTAKGRIKRAHRIAYELYTGEDIPPDMEIDHTCHIRRCVNPDHFDVVTRQENMKNLRKTEDWAVSEDEFIRKQTTPEKVLEDVKGILERSGVKIPEFHTGSERGYAIETVEGTPWRDIQIEEGYVPQDRYSRVKIFLDCIRMGVKTDDAAREILGISPFTLSNWSGNETWRYELAEAKRQGRKHRYSTIEDKHLDELERKIDFAEFKDVASSLKNLREQDEDRIAAKKNSEAGSNMPNVTIVFGGNVNPEKVLRSLVEMGEAIEGEFEVVEPKALP